ncbi:hypothetical protein [Paenibacillus periandrae]|uniref:hypothetical protein n=1 Tax=Paenibacillus periandrae TaxID=1761741 RepID=UPI001F093D8F|nr:hypothetical protein [Paenibacillus periandrae]
MKIAKVTVLVVSIFSLFHSISYADYSTAHIHSGKNTNGAAQQYWVDSSVSAYGLGATVTNAATQWSAVPNSAANLWEISSESLAQIKFYGVYNELGPGVYGSTGFFKSNGSQIAYSAVNSGTNFDIARIRLDNKSMTDDAFTSSEKYHNTGHELGHALSLSHFENSPAHAGTHWMKSGQTSMVYPSSVDADHLANKW